ncbi:MAG TPA: tripartite tricarboxylate transporter substrate-binding protein [Candidatus Binatia bacterium]
MRKTLAVIVSFAFVLAATGMARSADDEFFKNKTIRIIVGFAPGGGFDIYSRTIARHMGRHVPGNPTILVENMAGAGSLIAANNLYRVAKPDGLTIGNFHGNQILNQVIGGAGVEFDARRFEWIGVPVKDTGACALSKASGVTTLEQWKAAKSPVKLGGGGASGDTATITAKILKEALGLPIQVITGYKGTSEMRLAAESGELGGACFQWESIKTTWRNGLDSGEFRIVIQINPKRHPELANVPNAIEEAKTDEARQLIRYGLHDPAAMTRPYALPPGTPKERVQILRKAFLETFKDPNFIAEAKKSNLEVEPLSGEELQQLVTGVFKLDPALVAKLKEVMN